MLNIFFIPKYFSILFFSILFRKITRSDILNSNVIPAQAGIYLGKKWIPQQVWNDN
ncbi:MAG: hypothetical protein AAF611_16320 [Bacteroidota bacterium]